MTFSVRSPALWQLCLFASKNRAVNEKNAFFRSTDTWNGFALGEVVMFVGV